LESGTLAACDQGDSDRRGIQRQLKAMAASQQFLMADDIADSRRQVARLRETEWTLLVIGLGACILLAALISRSAIRPIRHAVEVADRIAAGELDVDINIAGSAEAKSLGTALSSMTASLSVAATANKDRAWLALGRQKLSDVVRGNADVITTTRNILAQLAGHLDCQRSVFYIVSKDQTMRTAACFGPPNDGQLGKEPTFGEGLVGRSALSGERIIVSGTPDGNEQATSSSHVIVPILYGGTIQAVIELHSAARLSERELDYLEVVSEDIAIAIDSAQNRERIRGSEQRIKAIVDTAADPVITITGKGLIQSFNRAAEKLFGYTEDEVLDENIKMLMPSPYREEHDEYLHRYLATGRSSIIGVGCEAVAQKRDGSTVPIFLSVSQVVVDDNSDDEGASILFTGIIRDLTEQKAMEAEQIARKSAEAANRAKSEFLANMSHEIRTPMTAILGYSEIVLGNVSDPQNIEGLQTIQRNGKYLLGIINDILDISKIESGKLQIEHIECSPCQILSDVASLMRVRASAKGLPLVIEYDGPIPKTIQSDPTRLRQILINVVGNAIKFTEVGKVRVVARLLDVESDEDKMQFEVIDTGIGMTEQQIGRLFRPFVQADTSTTRKFGGTGLGLMISKRLAEKLGGDVQVDSVAGEGSTFSVTVSAGPLGDVKMIAGPTETEASAELMGEQFVKPTRASTRLDGRILLAEDGPDNQRLISFVLSKAGAEVEVAENGQIALDRALAALDEGSPFDVILMDMQMPVLDGYAATSKLREAGYDRPIIALTAHAMSSDREKCIRAGCDDYMTKPIDREKLIAIVDQYASGLRSETRSEAIV
jgi:PAS domain S-box-containing protein